MAEKQRSSNLELFRIITMLLIVAHHYVVNSGLTAADGPILTNLSSWKSIFLLIFGAWGKTGINCFVLITGYFMCQSKITLKKFVKLIFEIELYKVVITCIFIITGYEAFSVKSVVADILPIRSIAQNFTGCYLMFFLCIPFLNILIRNINEKQHIYIILILGFIYIGMGTMPKFSVDMNYVSWFAVLFLISSYIRLYPKKIFERKGIWAILTLASIVLSVLSILVLIKLGLTENANHIYYFVADSNKIFAVTTALCAFMLFKNLKIRTSKFINTVAMSTFGVLLIHANSSTMRQWLWKDTINCVGAYNSPYMVVYAIGSVVIIFAVCTVIDYLRIRFIEKAFFKVWDKYEERIVSIYKKQEERLCRKLLGEEEK